MVDWQGWIADKTEGCKSVVDFGAGAFDKLGYCDGTVTRRIGIEIWDGCKSKREQNRDGHIELWGDMRDFESLIDRADMDCALFFDSIEHLDMEDAVDLLRRVQSRFNRILVMVPEGRHPQGATEGNPYNKHKSTWLRQDLEALGFSDIQLDPTFHPPHPEKARGCLFAVWRK